MNEFDEFCTELLEESKRFFEKSKEENDPEAQKAYNNASLLLAICALEAYINGISEEICLAHGYPLQIKSALLEKEIRLENGEFALSGSLKMSRLIDRIEIIYRKHMQRPISDSEEWWIDLKQGIDYRNRLVHPKDALNISIEMLERVIRAVIGCLTALYKAVYKRKFPKGTATITSSMTF